MKMLSTRWQRWWPFVALVVAAACRWLLVAARPEAESSAGSRALGCAWAAMLVLVLGRAPLGAVKDWRGLIAGAMMLGGPAVGLLAAGMDAGSLTIALALTPVVVAVAAAALGDGSDGMAGRLWPGLAAVAGLLLVLTQPNVSHLRSNVLLVLSPVLTGVGAALFCASRGRRIASALVGAATVLLLGWGWLRGTVSVVAVACDGLLALLGVLAVSRLGATRWSAQFALVPLLIVLEGLVLVRPGLQVRWVVGLVLIGVGSAYLLLPQDEG
jgi:drug/metabolite transporter (DMT)-like permease